MTIQNAIDEVNNLKPNLYGLPEKIKWLSRLDRRIFEEVLMTHWLSEQEKQPFLPEEELRPGPEEDSAYEIALDLPRRHRRRHPPAKLALKEYTEADLDRELIVKEPHDDIYKYWLSAQIDQNNMEFMSFNNSNAVFESIYSSYRNAFNRTHRPKGRRKIYY